VTELSIDPWRTALILIDLMPRIIALPLAPHEGPAVLARSVRLAEAVRAEGGLVVSVRVERTGSVAQAPGSGFAPGVEPHAGDLAIIKHTWGAFHETGLDAQLRARGIRVVALCGVATNFGVESTGRAADEHGYQVIFVSDAMSGLHEEAHDFAVEYVFSKIGIVCDTEELIAAVSERAVRPAGSVGPESGGHGGRVGANG
jgi:nicotinamidase-related amidase